MLVFVGGLGHFGEFPRLVEVGDCGGVEGEVAEGRAVGGALGEGTVGEVEVVGGAKEEYALSWMDRLISPCVHVHGDGCGKHTLWRGREICRPMRLRDRSRSSRHA